MSVGFWVTVVIVGVLGALFVMTMREALSERSRARVLAVYRFFVKPRPTGQEVPDEAR